METRIRWIIRNWKIITLSYILLASMIGIISFTNTISKAKAMHDEHQAGIIEYFNNCEFSYCQNASLRSLVILNARLQESFLYYIQLVIADPRLSTMENILLSSGKHEIEEHIKKYTLLLSNDEKATQIVAGKNATKSVTLLYDGDVLKFDPMKTDTFMYIRDKEIASYNISTNQLITKGMEGKTKLVLFDGLIRKDFEVIVK